jgi:hypothetical protein
VEIDLYTAVGVAIRDLQEIESSWGSAQAFERLAECQAMLRTVLRHRDKELPTKSIIL